MRPSSVQPNCEGVVVGGGGQGFARGEAEAHEHFELDVLGDAGHGAEGGRAGGGEIVRVGAEDGLVDEPEAHGLLIGFLALAFFHPALAASRADDAPKAESG